MIVSIMLMGALSVAVYALPALPRTFSTSGILVRARRMITETTVFFHRRQNKVIGEKKRDRYFETGLPFSLRTIPLTALRKTAGRIKSAVMAEPIMQNVFVSTNGVNNFF